MAKITLQAKSPTFSAAKLKGFTVHETTHTCWGIILCLSVLSDQSFVNNSFHLLCSGIIITLIHISYIIVHGLERNPVTSKIESCCFFRHDVLCICKAYPVWHLKLIFCWSGWTYIMQPVPHGSLGILIYWRHRYVDVPIGPSPVGATKFSWGRKTL